jgi:hypothetical protein
MKDLKVAGDILQHMRPIGFPKPIKEKKTYAWNSKIAISKGSRIAKRNKHPLKRTTRARNGKKKHRLPTIKSLKLCADRLFSLFICNRDKTCVLKSPKCWGQIQCGHLISRRIMALRYHEDNCHAQCQYHNSLHRFKPELYTSWFVNKYGSEAYSQLIMMEQVLVKANRLFFTKIIEKYK